MLHHCIFILSAGYDATTKLIGDGLALLCDHADQKHRLFNDSSLIDSAVECVLRMRSPNQFGNRDPQAFDNQTEFDTACGPNRHLAFAAGRMFVPVCPSTACKGTSRWRGFAPLTGLYAVCQAQVGGAYRVSRVSSVARKTHRVVMSRKH